MIIGIDVDGVLIDMQAFQLNYGATYFQKKLNRELVNPNGYDIEEMFQCTHEQREKFWIKHIWKYCLCEPMTENAASTIQGLKNAGHKIYIITGRVHTTESGITGKLFRWMLRHWLKKNNFYYDDIFWCSEKDSAADKYDVCIKEKVDFLVDDKAENLLALKDKIHIACYPALWNKNIRELDPYRIDKFEDIAPIIEKISTKLEVVKDVH